MTDTPKDAPQERPTLAAIQKWWSKGRSVNADMPTTQWIVSVEELNRLTALIRLDERAKIAAEPFSFWVQNRALSGKECDD